MDLQRWRVSDVAEASIGTLEGAAAQQLFQVADAARLSDGRIVVANSGTHEIRYFAPDGSYVFSTGREGAGPGEYRQITHLIRYPGDTLMVYDAMLQRGTVLGPDGHTVEFIDFGRSGPGRPISPLGRLTDGSLVVLFGSTRSFEGVSGIVTDTLDLARYSANGGFLGIIGLVAGGEAVVEAGVGPMQLAFGHPGPTVSVGDSAVFTRRGDGFEVGILSPEGRLVSIYRKVHERARVTDGLIERYRETRLSAVDQAFRSKIAKVLATMPYPETMPAISNLVVDREGNLWIEHYRSDGDERIGTWTILDSEGRWLGDVDLPAGLEVFEIGSDYVLGVLRDELGVEFVRNHHLDKPGL
jgi:hypothetical protein